MSSEAVSLAEPEDDVQEESVPEEIVPKRLLSVPDLFPRPSRSNESNISMPTVTKEVVTKYHSRPLSKLTSPDIMAKDPSAAKETEAEKHQAPSQVETQGHKVTSRVADKVKDILTGRAAGKVTARILGKKEEATDTKTAQSRSSAAQDGSGGQGAFVGKKLSSVDKVTLSNPGIPSIILDEDGGGRRRRTEFPHPFYSTLGRYKPHEPGDEAFSPITLAMSLEPEEGNRGSLKRPTLVIRRTLSTDRQNSKTSLTLHASTPGRGSPTKGGGGGGSPSGPGSPTKGGGGSKTELAVESDTALESESVLSSAMMQSVVSIMKFMTQSSAQARESAMTPSDRSAAEAGRSSGADGAAESLPRDPLGPGPMTEDEMETLRLSVRAMVGLQRWKKRANARLSQKAGPHVTVKSFAKNAQHNTILQNNLEEIATELPLPLLKTLHDEAFPIINDIRHAYERTLGKTNSLTEQAKARVERMAKFIKAYDEM